MVARHSHTQPVCCLRIDLFYLQSARNLVHRGPQHPLTKREVPAGIWRCSKPGELGVNTEVPGSHHWFCDPVPEPLVMENSGMGQILSPQSSEEKHAFGSGPQRGHLSLVLTQRCSGIAPAKDFWQEHQDSQNSSCFLHRPEGGLSLLLLSENHRETHQRQMSEF